MQKAQTLPNQNEKIKLIAMSGVLAALIYIFTAFLHIPTGAGYTHAGDGVIFLAASLLPTPYAIGAAVIGAGLADTLSGFVVWLPATAVIKAVTVLFFTSKSDRILNRRNLLALLPSLMLCVVGYSLYEGTVMAGAFSRAAVSAAFVQTPAYCTQTAISSALYIAVGKALDVKNDNTGRKHTDLDRVK